MERLTMAALRAAGALTFGDGYRTKRSEHGQPGFRILRVSDVGDGRVSLNGPDFVSAELCSAIGQKRSQPGDVLLTTKGTVGRVAIMPVTSERVVYSPQLCYFRVLDDAVVQQRYLAFWFRSESFRSQALHRANNTDMAPYINLTDIASLRVELPPIAEQRAIAEVLGALDDKIAANERRLHVLAELDDVQSQLVLRLSESTTTLDTMATVTKGVSYRRGDLVESRTALVTLKSIDRVGKFSWRGFKEYAGVHRQAQRLAPGDIVVAQTDLTQRAEVIGWAVRVPHVNIFEDLVASLDLGIVRPIGSVPVEYLLAALRQPAFRAHCHSRMSGTTVLHLGRGAIESYPLPQVGADQMRRLADRAHALHESADAIDRESRSIAHTRDQLLPLLMSAKLPIRDAAEMVEEVLS